MNHELEIRTLTDRFFDGETTLQEEHRLYELYRQATNLPADLAPIREMMLDMEAMKQECGCPTRLSEKRKVKSEKLGVRVSQPDGNPPSATFHFSHFTFHSPFLRIAASLLLLVGTATVWYTTVERQNECVAYVYGQRTTDHVAVMQEMQLAMNAVADDDATDLMEQQLKELFAE